MLRRLGLSVALLAASACSNETVDGRVLAEAKGCVACHGVNGKGTVEIYPNLNGQWERYLRLQLLAYRSGERDNAIMNGMAAALTDDEIRALAAHYGR